MSSAKSNILFVLAVFFASTNSTKASAVTQYRVSYPARSNDSDCRQESSELVAKITRITGSARISVSRDGSGHAPTCRFTIQGLTEGYVIEGPTEPSDYFWFYRNRASCELDLIEQLRTYEEQTGRAVLASGCFDRSDHWSVLYFSGIGLASSVHYFESTYSVGKLMVSAPRLGEWYEEILSNRGSVIVRKNVDGWNPFSSAPDFFSQFSFAYYATAPAQISLPHHRILQNIGSDTRLHCLAWLDDIDRILSDMGALLGPDDRIPVILHNTSRLYDECSIDIVSKGPSLFSVPHWAVIPYDSGRSYSWEECQRHRDLALAEERRSRNVLTAWCRQKQWWHGPDPYVLDLLEAFD